MTTGPRNLRTTVKDEEFYVHVGDLLEYLEETEQRVSALKFEGPDERLSVNASAVHQSQRNSVAVTLAAIIENIKTFKDRSDARRKPEDLATDLLKLRKELGGG